MNSRIWDIIGKHIRDQSSLIEDKELQAWLAEDAENESILSEVKRVWEQTGKISRLENVDLDAEWNAFKSYRDEQDQSNKGTEEGKTGERSIRWIYPIAAMLVLGVGLAYFFGYTQFETEPQNLIVHATTDQRQEVKLPDGSSVWLNRESSISYNEDFGSSNRDLEMTGEVFFDVNKSDLTFTIVENRTKTEVLGTAFGIRSGTSDLPSEIVVLRGKVAFSELNNPTNKVELGKGEKASLPPSGNNIVKSNADDPNWLAWKEQVFVFNATKLSDVTTTLSRYFNIDLKVNNPTLNECHFTGTFNDPQLIEVLDVLSVSLSFEYQIEDGGVIRLSGGSCQ